VGNLAESDEAATQSAKDVAAAERLQARIAELDEKVFQGIARRREASIEMGRAFNELKRILGHGKWQQHFEETFEPCGLTLRTAERYMERARKADAVTKNDKLSIFKPAADQGAQEIRDATEEARAEVAASSGHTKLRKKNKRYVYRFPLNVTDIEKDAMDTLLTLPDWPLLEKRILSLLRRIWMEYGILDERPRRRS